MVEEHLTTETQERENQWEWLGDLLNRVFWPIEGLIETLDGDENYSNLLSVLSNLVDCAKADLAILDDILAKSLGGHLKVETADTLRIYGTFRPYDFGKTWPEDPQAAGQEGGA